jgi:CRP-like cAMP-binding protein
MISITTDTLAAISAFKELERPDRAQIAKLCASKTYPKSSVIIAHKEETSDVFFLVSGSVRATIFTERGREISYQDLFAGDMFGELSAIDRMPRSTHVVALQESILLSLPSALFSEILMRYPVVAQATLQKIARMVRFLCDRVYEFGALDVNDRIRAELIRLATGDVDKTDRATIPKMPTHQELANRLATHREAVSRELSSLEKKGLITKHGRSLVITDVNRLSALIGDSRAS